MNSYVISCCSTTDPGREYLEQRQIAYVYFHFSLNGRDYYDDFGETVPPKELYRRMLAGEDARTSQVSVGEYCEHFRKILSSGRDILHVCLSSGISGTLGAAKIAAEDMAGEYPDRKILVVDSLDASAGYGLLVDLLADLRDSGASLEEAYEWALAHRLSVRHLIFTSDLTFLIKGGRVSKTAGLIGGMLGICPIIIVDREGKLQSIEKVRCKKRVIKRIADMMAIEAENGRDYAGKVYLCHGDCEEDAKALAQLIEAGFPKIDGPVRILPFGATIGAHTGPATVALFFMGKER